MLFRFLHGLLLHTFSGRAVFYYQIANGVLTTHLRSLLLILQLPDLFLFFLDLFKNFLDLHDKEDLAFVFFLNFLHLFPHLFLKLLCLLIGFL